MLNSDRRLGFRIPVQMFLNQYIRDRPRRALSANISDTGVYLNTVKTNRHYFAPPKTRVGLEFELPGTGEVIWALGEVCYHEPDDYVVGTGIRFAAMPRVHARMVRDFCVETRRAHLTSLLERIRQPPA
jgi:hypothetical protein